MRESDLHDNKAWIVLSLLDAWLDGDRYFEAMMKKHHLTPIDMIGILAALQKAGEEPPQLYTLPGRLSTFDEGGGDFPPFPVPTPSPGGDHIGPGGGWPGGGPHPSPGTPHPPPGPTAGGGFNPGDPSTWGPRPVHHKTTAEELKEWQDTYLGAHGGEPAVPAPTDVGYTPQPGEKKVTFKCEGAVVYGYPNGCMNFLEKSFNAKWTNKFGRFLERKDDAFREYVYHHVWSDGRKAECTHTCGWLGNLECYGGAAGILAICSVLTSGACITGLPGIAAGIGIGGAGANQCTKELDEFCASKLCIH